jgi:O-methyltransferase involved in polyketide biosynthesis
MGPSVNCRRDRNRRGRAARAMASQHPDALLNDPWADPLVRAVSIDTCVQLIDGEIGQD